MGRRPVCGGRGGDAAASAAWPERDGDLRALDGWAALWEEAKMGTLALGSPPSQPPAEDVTPSAVTSPRTCSLEIAGGADGPGPGPAAGSPEAALLLRRVLSHLRAADAADAAFHGVVRSAPKPESPLPPSTVGQRPSANSRQSNYRKTVTDETWAVCRAEPAAIWFSGEPLLRFGLLKALQKRPRILTWATTLAVGMVAFLFFFQPGAVAVTITREANGQSEDLTFLRYGTPLWFAVNVSVSVMTVLYLHIVDLSLFIAVAQSFEFLVIFSSCLAGRLTMVYLKVTVLAESGKYDWEWLVWDCCSAVFAGGATSLLVGASDSWQASRKAKLIACFLAMAYFGWASFYHTVLSPQWPRKTYVSAGLQRFFDPREFHASMDSQVAVFLAKNFVAIFRGRRFAFIHPVYVHETTEECLEGSEVAGAAPLAQPVVLAAHTEELRVACEFCVDGACGGGTGAVAATAAAASSLDSRGACSAVACDGCGACGSCGANAATADSAQDSGDACGGNACGACGVCLASATTLDIVPAGIIFTVGGGLCEPRPEDATHLSHGERVSAGASETFGGEEFGRV